MTDCERLIGYVCNVMYGRRGGEGEFLLYFAGLKKYTASYLIRWDGWMDGRAWHGRKLVVIVEIRWQLVPQLPGT